MGKNRTCIRLCGQEFNITGSECEEYIRQIASYVDDKIDTVQRKYPNFSTLNAVLLVALDLSDELHKLRADYQALDSRIDQLRNLPRSQSEAKGPVKRPFETPMGTATK